MKELRDEIKQVEEPLKNNGVKLEKPLLTIDTLGTPAIPHMRITHRGYVKLRDREILPLEV
jgi:adenine deaminase